ncbi:aminotransferase-like domain-containing protein [Dyadobacter psychrotolerans]|uniref:PLP-dependent aminotransferase family protein n=1 Tax=Dyadobacter psychrotolerans TaxID=2541721 RepID=A0A4R5DMN5_9BACT|nr:PLP-dependent aminotransferase family protein [Dyadobacter psychrotolerans]TDE15409.1 PLP-dependent aminotransferase family protein [Dyadobacter psychrotolerans]
MNILNSLLTIDKSQRPAVYLQIANQLMEHIKNGKLKPGYKLLSSRDLSAVLGVHRRTVVQAYDELLAQGWLESVSGSGTFIASHLPQMLLQRLTDPESVSEDPIKRAGFDFSPVPMLDRPALKVTSSLHLDDGFPDARLAPLEELSRAYRSQLLTGNAYARLGYGDTKGALWLRKELSSYLNDTRGLNTSCDNILIVRGTIMGLFLVSSGLLANGDNVVVGEMGWYGAKMNFQKAGANILSIRSDQHGLDIDELEALCKKRKIRLIYVTSHHQYPTTVALRADRRIRLLQLAEQYGFIIFEDDYDYDFHYLSKPLLPLASADPAGMTLYCGSFTKAISPAFRVGYLVGPENVITHLSQLRRIIDRQGDTILENTIADLLQSGVIQRHLRKSVREYKQRRDVFCNLLKDELGDQVDFQIPDGGMAVWTRFDPAIDLKLLAEKALQKGLYFADGKMHNDNRDRHATRLGFASSTPKELEISIEILKKQLKQ